LVSINKPAHVEAENIRKVGQQNAEVQLQKTIHACAIANTKIREIFTPKAVSSGIIEDQ